MLPLETHALLLSFNSWALSFCKFLFCQLDKPSKHLGFTLVLDNTSFLILSLFNFLSLDLTLGMIVVNIFLPLIAKVSNTLIGFSSLGANRNSYPCGHLFSLDKLSYPPFSYFELWTDSFAQNGIF
jgi:hypothetical protein